MNRRAIAASFCTVLLASISSGRADPAPIPNTEQRHFINDCAVMSQAVLEFAKARDQGMAKMDAFTYVTRGQAKYDPGSQVDQTLQWAFDHADEDPITTAAHFHGHCTLDAWELLTPISEKELTTSVQDCQHDHAGKPDQIRACIDSKITAMLASANALNNTPEETDVAVAPPPEPQRPLRTAAAPQPKAIAPVGSPPPAIVLPATQLAAAAPPVTQAPRVAMASLPAGAPVAPVGSPPPAIVLPATQVAAAAPSAVQVPTVAMAPMPAGAPVTPVGSPPPAIVLPATQVAATAPSAVQVPTVAMTSVPAGAPVTPVASPPPAIVLPATQVAAAPPPVTQAPTVAMATVPAAAPVAPVSAPQFTPPEPVQVASAPAPALPLPAPTPAAPASAPQVVAAAPAPASAPASSAAVPQLAVASSGPASLAGIGKLSIGMSMDDAAKVMQSYGQDDTDANGNPARTFLISNGHGYIELTTEPGKPEVVYGIEYHGGADAKVPPILGVHLGDGAADVLTHVGQPSNRSQVLDERTLWSYAGRNYSFELSSGGDLITIRIAGYDGLPQAASDSTQVAAASVP
jgi:hypothetical protein